MTQILPVSPIYFNVKTYGAKGDGTTDDSAAITAAFSAANSAGGGYIYFPPGTYISSTEQDVPSNCTVGGSGYNSIIRRRTGSSSYLVNVLRVNSKSNVRITNLQIDGQKADIITNYSATALSSPYIYTTCNGVYVTGASTDVTIDHCWIHDAYFGNVAPDSVDGMVIESNYLYNGRDNQINGRVQAALGGICTHVTVADNIVIGAGPQSTANQFSGIQFIRSTYLTITGNVCELFGNTNTHEGDGIGLEGCRHVTISGNTCTHNLDQGIKVDWTVEGVPAAWDAIDSYVPGDCVSYLSNNFVAATYNTNATPPSTATSNTNWTYQATGPYNQRSVDVTISNNVCSDNNYFAATGDSSNGILVQNAEDVLVEGNKIYGNYYGFSQGSSVRSLTIRGNDIYNNQSVGIAFYNNSNAYGPFLIENNYIARNGAKGIDVVVPMVIKGNTLHANAGAGIAVNITGTVVQAHPFFLIQSNVGIDNGDDMVLVNGGFASTVPVEVRDNYAAASTTQPRFLGENGTPTRCVNNRVDTQNVELWYFTSTGSVWIDSNSRQMKSVTANYTVGVLDDIVLVTPASATTITLPAPNATHPSAQPGRMVTVSKTNTSANAVTLATAGGTINLASLVVGNQTAVRLVSDGTNWNPA